jgi:hypothetical protein
MRVQSSSGGLVVADLLGSLLGFSTVKQGNLQAKDFGHAFSCERCIAKMVVT